MMHSLRFAALEIGALLAIRIAQLLTSLGRFASGAALVHDIALWMVRLEQIPVTLNHVSRHGRARPGHPRLAC